MSISLGGQDKLPLIVCFMCRFRIEDMSIARMQGEAYSFTSRKVQVNYLFGLLFNCPAEVVLFYYSNLHSR
jgi:hypothetical protein